MSYHELGLPADSGPMYWQPLRWMLYVVPVAYFVLSATCALGHLQGKNAHFWRRLLKNADSEETNEAAYRAEVGASLAIIGSTKFPLTDTRYLLPNGVTVRNFGVVHMYEFFHKYRDEILGAVKDAKAISAEYGSFFRHCEAYARAHGIVVANLNESRKRDRAATWGVMVLMINFLVSVGAAAAVLIVVSRRVPDRIHPDRRFRWKNALEGWPNIRTACGSWRCELRRQADARKTNPIPKRTFSEHMADIRPMLRGLVAPGHRPATWASGIALVLLLGTHAIFTWGVIDPSGSQSIDASSPALSQLVDRFSADVDQPEGIQRTVFNSAMLHDSHSMFENAKSIAQSMSRGSTLLLLTGDRHAKDFEAWFRADHDFSTVPASTVVVQ